MRNAVAFILVALGQLSACQRVSNRTASPTNVPTAASTPTKTPPTSTALPNLALASRVDASGDLPYVHPMEHALDGNTQTWWGAGGTAPQWIEFNLGSPSEIGMIRLIPRQDSPGEAIHEIWGMGSDREYTLLHRFSERTQDGTFLDFIPGTPLKNIRAVKIQTVSNPGDVAWREVEIVSPGAVANRLSTPTPAAVVTIEQLRLDTPEDSLDRTFDYVQDFWPELTRKGSHTDAFPLPGDFIVPGGFFDWFFYWDSYFILTGLVTQGHWDLGKDIVDNFIVLIEEYGRVPNYVAPDAVCSSRSQPPYLTAAIQEVFPYIQDDAWLARAYEAAKREYEGFWTVEPHLVPETGLSRYYDETGAGCLTVPDTLHFRAIAESGWDNTPRFGPDASQVLPVDLNSQLYRYEVDLAEFAAVLGRPQEARIWRERAEARRTRMTAYFWDGQDGFFKDYDLRSGTLIQGTPKCLSGYVPMWAGLATQAQANSLVDNLSLFETEHGLATCEPGWPDNTQHNFPVAWAYSHWYVTYGLRKYGFHEEAARIAYEWVSMVADRWAETGVLWERYNVVDPGKPASGRYQVQQGFGWTNAVYVSELARIIFGAEADWYTGDLLWDPRLPPAWEGAAASVSLPNYPYQGGISINCESWPQPCEVTRGTR